MAEAGDGSGHTPLTPEWTPAPRASHYPWQGDRPAAAPSIEIWPLMEGSRLPFTKSGGVPQIQFIEIHDPFREYRQEDSSNL